MQLYNGDSYKLIKNIPDNSVDLIIKRATNGITSGDIVLMHPKPHTLSALPTIINNIKSAGLNAVTVSECANLTVNL
jgi:peptidoglycan/xylan/chitin deacetylase (PgdA/CDA1 family)